MIISYLRTLVLMVLRIKRDRGMSLSDICKRALKLTLLGIAGSVIAVVADIVLRKVPGGLNNLGENLFIGLFIWVGLALIVASFLYKIILLISNLDKKVELAKIYIVEFFVAIFFGMIVLFDKAGFNTGSVLEIGFLSYSSIACVYYLYCKHAYRGR